MGVMLCYAMLCYAMLCYAMLCYVMLCLCYAMLCYAMLCYVKKLFRGRVEEEEDDRDIIVSYLFGSLYKCELCLQACQVPTLDTTEWH